MPFARKRPCTICRKWYRPDPRIGARSRACRKPECQTARRKKTQAAWRARNPDYYIARRIQARGGQERTPEPLRLPEPLSRLPWDIAQDEFGVKGADFIGVMGTVLLRAAQDQFKVDVVDSGTVAGTHGPRGVQDQMRLGP
jgi:hypothetical protein